MEQKSIFISHAAADKEIADKVVDLLNLGVGINVTEDVFCSSLEGLGIPQGYDFKRFIKKQIQNPKIVIILISQNYLASQFCLAEAGASWAMSHEIIPFLVPPVEYKDMRAIFANVQVSKIVDSAGWNEALERFKHILGANPKIPRWERKRDEKIKEIQELLLKQQQPAVVTYNKFQNLQEKLVQTEEENVELETENSRLKHLITDLKKLKDVKKVNEVELASLPDTEQFKKLIASAKRATQVLPDIVREAFYYHFSGEHLVWPRNFGEESRRNAIRTAMEYRYLLDRDGDICVNTDEPKVSWALESLSNLNDFIRGVSNQFSEAYAVENEECLVFSSRQFWNRYIF